MFTVHSVLKLRMGQYYYYILQLVRMLIMWLSVILLLCVYVCRQKHFESRGSPLKGLRKYYDKESHEKRYISAVSYHQSIVIDQLEEAIILWIQGVEEDINLWYEQFLHVPFTRWTLTSWEFGAVWWVWGVAFKMQSLHHFVCHNWTDEFFIHWLSAILSII